MSEVRDSPLNYISIKPDLPDINEFLNGRLKPSGESPGINISSDHLNNTVYTSNAYGEETIAGLLPSQLVVSSEGKSVIRHNPGLLQGIRTGEIVNSSTNIGGFESNVYKISLKTENGDADYALKYTFPIDGGDAGFFTSGVVAMRLMQEAGVEKPVPYVGYVEPVLATHDITLAPFTFEGVSFANFMDYIDPEDHLMHRKIEDIWSTDPRVIAKLRSLRKLEDSMPQERNFLNEIYKFLGPYHSAIVEWVEAKVKNDYNLQKHGFNTEDTTIRQTVIDLERVEKIMKRFKSNSKFGAGNDEFEQSLLSTLSFVELGVGKNAKANS